jgi:formamidopyrimidine-DNA glycosylase
MPELPEVQTVVDTLQQAELLGRWIIDARVFWPRTIEPLAPHEFSQSIKDRRITGLGRRGKYILMHSDGPETILVHLRMTGSLNLVPADTPRDKHEHVVLGLDDGRELRFHDPRKFGRFTLTTDPAEVLAHLGPEPLEESFTTKRFHNLVRERSRQLKPLLLDQTVVAGLGNIYVDEALWNARLHPLRSATSLTWEEAKALHRAIRSVLRRSIRSMGTSLGEGEGNFTRPGGRYGQNNRNLKVFRRTGKPCSRCGTAIERLIVGQRSTHLCPVCQRAGDSESLV